VSADLLTYVRCYGVHVTHILMPTHIATLPLLLCRFVEREWHADTGMVSVAGVDEGRRIEAAAGDLLFLKGQNYPGLYGE